MKIAAIICFCAALASELYGVWGLLQTARAARTVLFRGVEGTHPVVDNDDGTFTLATSDSGLFAGEEAALQAQATPRLAIVALVFGIVVGFVGNLLSL